MTHLDHRRSFGQHHKETVLGYECKILKKRWKEQLRRQPTKDFKDPVYWWEEKAELTYSYWHWYSQFPVWGKRLSEAVNQQATNASLPVALNKTNTKPRNWKDNCESIEEYEEVWYNDHRVPTQATRKIHWKCTTPPQKDGRATMEWLHLELFLSPQKTGRRGRNGTIGVNVTRWREVFRDKSTTSSSQTLGIILPNRYGAYLSPEIGICCGLRVPPPPLSSSLSGQSVEQKKRTPLSR